MRYEKQKSCFFFVDCVFQRFFLAAMALAIVCGSARSDDLFRVVAVGGGTTVVVSGSVSDFTAGVRTELTNKVATEAGVPPTAVFLDVVAASVQLTFTINLPCVAGRRWLCALQHRNSV